MGGRGSSSGIASISGGLSTDKNGDYHITGYINTEQRVDKTSSDYKQGLRNCNVRASFNQDGSVSVAKGGLFERKRNFKSVQAFQSEYNKRIDSVSKYHESEMQRIKSGRLVQLEGENYKSIIRTNSSAQAFKKIRTDREKLYQYHKTVKAAAQEMKQRLEFALNEKNKR